MVSDAKRFTDGFPYQQVQEFHTVFGHPVGDTPDISDKDLLKLRWDLIDEEVNEELKPAIEAGDIVEIADALADILYVTIGAMLALGLKPTEVFNEVHHSNMSKLGEDGKPIYRGDGKILKGPDYFPPDIAGILNA